MRISDRIKSILQSPSQRGDIDYTKTITQETIQRILYLLSEFPSTHGVNVDIHTWFDAVGRDFIYLHHDFARYYSPQQPFPYEFDPVNPLNYFNRYFQSPSTKPSAFLDFLEISFRNNSSPQENDLIKSLNLILENSDCPYRLSEYIWSEIKGEGVVSWREVKTYPFIYLAQEPIVDKYSIKPALKLFADPDYIEVNKSFSKALKRYKAGDDSGAATLCQTTLEEAILVISRKNGKPLKSKGLGKIVKEFIRKGKYQDPKWKNIIDFIAERRNNTGDSHAKTDEDPTNEDAFFLIGITSSLIVFLASKYRRN